MGLVDHRGRVLGPFLFLAEIRSGPTVHTILDLGHADSHGRVADCKCELELDFLPQEGSLVELCSFCALSSISLHSRGSSASYSQPALRLVCPLPCLSRICNLVGLPSLASQPWLVPNQLMLEIHSLRTVRGPPRLDSRPRSQNQFSTPLTSRGRYAPETAVKLSDFVEAVYLPRMQEQKRPSTYFGYRDIWKKIGGEPPMQLSPEGDQPLEQGQQYLFGHLRVGLALFAS